MARNLTVFGLIICSLLSFGASALTIGDIELDSALNQPFSAGVALTAGSAEELDTLQVRLASQAAFNDYGLDRPGYLNDLRFEVVRTSATTAVLRLEGSQTIVEPFVTLLVRFNWSAGNLLREYTVLLDPPIFDTAAPATEVEQAQSAPAETAQPIAREAAAPAPVAPAQRTRPAPEQVSEAPVSSRPAPRTASFDGDAYGPIANGSSLWNIAERLREGTDLSTNQMMIALYRANPEAFMGNINRLKAGSILRMPEADALNSVSPGEANREVQSQHQAWKSGTSVAAASSEPAQLKLMPPSESFDSDSAGDGFATAGSAGDADSGDVSALQSELEETRRLLAIKDQELVDLQERLAAVESGEQADLLSDLAEAEAAGDELPDSEMSEGDLVDGEMVDGMAATDGADAAMEEGADGEPVALMEDAMVDEGADAEAVAEDAAANDSGMPAASTTNVVTTESADSGSLLDTVLGVLTNIWLWIVVGVLVVVALVFFRRKKPAPAIGSSLLDDEDDDPLTTPSSDDDLASAPFASAVPDGYERNPATDSMVVEEGLAEDFLKKPEDDDADSSSTAEIPALDEDASDETEFEVAPPDDFDIGLDTIGSDNQDDLLGLGGDEEGLEKTAELTPGAPLDPTATIGSETAINLDHADPIAEADFHMAYGLYDQAAELLVKALEDDSEDQMIRMKLLEVYFVWEKKDGFIEEAVKLRESVSDESDPDWNKVVIMGKQIAPDHELFSGASGAGGAQIMDMALGADSADDVDMDFGFDEDDQSEDSVDLNFDPGNTSIGLGENNDTLDFDIGNADSPTMESPTIEAPGSESPTMETPTIEAVGSEAPTMETPTLEFPGSDAPTMETPTIESPAVTDDDAVDSSETASIDLDDLDIDFAGLDDADDASESTQSDIGGTLNDLDFDLDEQTAQDIGSDDTEIELGDDDATMLASNVDLAVDEALAADSAEVELGDDDATMLAGDIDVSQFIKNDLESDATQDMPAAGDTVEQPALADEGDTVEQPSISEASKEADSMSFSDDVFGDDAGAADDLHAETHAMESLDDSDLAGLDGGVDTKLDLAKAYIDMGDSDGARSILNEVIEEGDSDEQEKARDLIESLAS